MAGLILMVKMELLERYTILIEYLIVYLINAKAKFLLGK